MYILCDYVCGNIALKIVWGLFLSLTCQLLCFFQSIYKSVVALYTLHKVLLSIKNKNIKFLSGLKSHAKNLRLNSHFFKNIAPYLLPWFAMKKLYNSLILNLIIIPSAYSFKVLHKRNVNIVFNTKLILEKKCQSNITYIIIFQSEDHSQQWGYCCLWINKAHMQKILLLNNKIQACFKVQ